MNATLSTSTAGVKPAPAAAHTTRREPRAKPQATPKPRPDRTQDVWAVIAASKCNRDARAIVAAGNALLKLIRKFLDDHDEVAFSRALRAAGLSAEVRGSETGENLHADMSALEWNLALGIGIIDSLTIRTPDADEREATPPRKSR